jgi:MFS family permease
LVGPYFFAGFGLLVAAAVIFIWLRPDPFVLSQAETAKVPNPPIRQTLQRLLGNRDELTGLLSISLGHISMIMIMVMTPVHMKHESASIQIIGLVISIHILGMYALAPVMGWLADKYGRIQTIWVGLLILLASAAISATAHNHTTLTIGLFLLGLGWSGTLVAGSALLTEATSVSDRPAVQGVSDLVMNASGALGGALAGIVIAVSSYAALCAVAALPPLYLGVRLLRNH